ncbi:transcriptional regulator opi1 [Yamadazyma tenuis]|uniref:Uncharacterized protein n=1 Tax=Candida tenuis (strain ATCC 10573 / BCRC 21748 / CBS 615 / JCM 9827 / NBRC 10315 / NRRL Y-1498 / VKM Y-70) TaxID=590646 RepID=G3B9S3_CANTC|nr:uncharacterized protein CANTEDRAFT_135885 [Yamadazyma tenuis ATCC 10573]EGV61956.1 hypothetical protein CANTEDRAFT_135885 [Yamadazyma tenuis ATCC 10573]WEJ93202.1 transcriptional regulator opi1 [Yamadazyma tenuis]
MMTDSAKRNLSNTTASDSPPSYSESNAVSSHQASYATQSAYPYAGYTSETFQGKESESYVLPPLETPNAGSPLVVSPAAVNDDLVAAEALTRLTATPPPMNHISTPMSNLSIDEGQSSNSNELKHPLIAKVSRVTQHPIVRDAFKYYEDSKRNYPHFNYAAGIVERAAIPMVNRIELNLNSRHRHNLEKPIKKKKRKLNRTDRKETKKRLQFCLHLLRLANDQITNQVTFFQSKLADREVRREQPEVNDEKSQFEKDDDNVNVDSKSIQQTPTRQQSPTSEGEKNEPNQVAQETNTEIIAIVKKIIHVISNFKASNLNTDNSSGDSTELRSTIRDIILKLPSQLQQSATPGSNTQQTNDKIFVFAKESLDMISRLTNVFDDQLKKAETWIGADDNASTPAQPNGSETGSDFGSSTQSPTPNYTYNGDNKIQS